MGMIKYIAIDPGWSGAIVMLDDNGNISVNKMPQTAYDILDFFKELETSRNVMCTLEKVGSMPGNGVKSVWRFAENATAIKCGLYSASISFEEVTPQSWMKKLGTAIPKEKTPRKNKIKALMQQAYPSINITLANSDALAIMYTKLKESQ